MCILLCSLKHPFIIYDHGNNKHEDIIVVKAGHHLYTFYIPELQLQITGYWWLVGEVGHREVQLGSRQLINFLL